MTSSTGRGPRSKLGQVAAHGQQHESRSCGTLVRVVRWPALAIAPGEGGRRALPPGSDAPIRASRAGWTQRHVGHGSVTLATAAVFGARFVGYFGRSAGQGGAGVAKDAGQDVPAKAHVTAATRVQRLGAARTNGPVRSGRGTVLATASLVVPEGPTTNPFPDPGGPAFPRSRGHSLGASFRVNHLSVVAPADIRLSLCRGTGEGAKVPCGRDSRPSGSVRTERAHSRRIRVCSPGLAW